jgi:hypothetical protein
MVKRTLGIIVVILVSAVICSAQSVVYLPQYVDGTPGGGGFWGSIIAVSNAAAPGTPISNGTVTVNRDDGTPLTVAFVDENGAPTTNAFQLAGGQTKIFLSPTLAGNGLPPFNVGFATVSSDLPVTAGLVFVEGDGTNGTTSQAGVAGVTPLTKQAAVAVRNPTLNTGVAIAYAGPGTTTITFQLLDKSGTLLVPAVTRTLNTNNHTAFFISELFPTAPASITGTLRMISTQGIVAMALLITQPKGLLASTPTFPVQ